MWGCVGGCVEVSVSGVCVGCVGVCGGGECVGVVGVGVCEYVCVCVGVCVV